MGVLAVKKQKRSSMELSFPLADILGAVLTYDGGINLTGTVKKTLKLGMGASLPIEGEVVGKINKKALQSTVICDLVENLSLILRHDYGAGTDSLWLYNNHSLILDDLSQSSDELDLLLKEQGPLIKFMRQHTHKKWQRV